MRVFGAAVRLQLRIVRSDPDYLMPLVTVPLFSITFLAIVRQAGRDDLTGCARGSSAGTCGWSRRSSSSRRDGSIEFA
jgi:hypothetical protein